MVSRQDHGELMCWVSVDQVLKQATIVDNLLCLSRDYDGVFRRANDDQYDISSETWYGHEGVFGDLFLEAMKGNEEIAVAFKKPRWGMK